MRLFVDTSAFLALEDGNDRNHKSAIEFRNAIRDSLTPYRILYTTNYVLDETLTIIQNELGHSSAISFGEAIKSSKLVEILWIDKETDSNTWNIFKKYKDKNFSYTDCSSFATMDREGIDSVFTFDKHFAQYGFKSLP